MLLSPVSEIVLKQLLSLVYDITVNAKIFIFSNLALTLLSNTLELPPSPLERNSSSVKNVKSS